MLDIQLIAKTNNIDTATLAAVLFPNNKRQTAALARVLTGETQLYEIQISRLAQHLNVTISELYELNGTTSVDDESINFEFGDCGASLDTRSFLLRIWHKGELIHDTVILKKAITTLELTQYIKTIYNNK